jgi:hypothetical protein
MRKRKHPSKPVDDPTGSLAPLDPNHTLIAVIEMSQQSWHAAGIVPGVERQSMRKLEPDVDCRYPIEAMRTVRRLGRSYAQGSETVLVGEANYMKRASPWADRLTA